MSGKSLHLVFVGRLRTSHWINAAAHYHQRLAPWRKVEESIVKDGASSLPPKQRMAEEGRGILAALAPQDRLVCLDEQGKSLTSRQFAAMLEELSLQGVPCFVVGGAFGLDEAVRQKARQIISLGSHTMTHELARVVLLEQLYRAESILRKSPYHH